jgi:hydrogenase maturation factor
MNKEDKIRLLKMAISCLREEGEKRPIFSLDVPTNEEIEIIKNSLENGDVNENLLKRFFPMAYKGVINYGFFEYFFYAHNKTIRMLERYTHDKRLVEWCTAYPAKIVDRTDSKWVVETIDGKKLVTDSEAYSRIIVEKELKIGDFVVLHRNKIHIVLNEKEFDEASEFYNKFKEEKDK